MLWKELLRARQRDSGPPNTGGLIVGVFFEVLFLGMIINQVVFYVPRSSRDPVLLKVLAATLFFSVMLKAALDIRTVYSCYVFGVYKTADPVLPWSIKVGFVLGQIPLLASQLYLCFRLWAASERRKLPTAIGLLGCCASCAMFIVYAVRRNIMGNKQILQNWLPLWAFSACASRRFAIDLYLSITFAYYLLRARQKAVSYRLEFMLGRLASITITTCFPPAIFSLLLAVLEMIAPDRSPWLFFSVNVASVYALCILHTLNSRKQITEDAVRIANGDPTGAGLANMHAEGDDRRQPASLISILSRTTRAPGVSKTTFDEEAGLSSRLGRRPGHSIQHLQSQGSIAQGVEYEVKVERTIERMNSIDFSALRKTEEEGDMQLMGTPATDAEMAEAKTLRAANKWTSTWSDGPPGT
ncbi:BQ2448_6424 [Microbotryum intermedium]|uniref:BQ2448_6424 protein n=1 Tax=Microbotryum intermedium TaxID=269621 RepID=A0A238FQ29_9BASI|nr:BQ2448_6424 [Microbotryum intermedium]